MVIYLDNSATTRIDNSVIDEMTKFAKDYYANPSSLYSSALETRNKIEDARAKIARFINAEPEEIIFTSGATESNNFALKGLALANPTKKHIITSAIEHPSILNTCKTLEKLGYEVDYIKVDHDGLVNINDIKKKIRDDTLVVSIMFVNNEIGTIEPIEEIADICKKKDVYFHTDAVQGFKKLPIDVKKMNIDLLSMSGHKINAPKGIGFLYIKGGVRIKRFIDGGEQELRLRAGTENVLGIIALAKALDVDLESDKVKDVRNYLVEKIKTMKNAIINGSMKNRIYNNLNVSFYGIEGEGLMLLLDKDNICVSTGSACSSRNLEESHVLKAINVDPMYIHGSVRITLDKEISKDDIDFFFNKLNIAVQKLSQMSPFKFEDEKTKNN
jgi:cysteine desulfurase